MPVSEHAVAGEVGPMAYHVTPAMAAAVAAAAVTAAVTAATHENKRVAIADGSLQVHGRNPRLCCGNRLRYRGVRQQGQAKSCCRSCYDSFHEHEIPPNRTLANVSKPNCEAASKAAPRVSGNTIKRRKFEAACNKIVFVGLFP
jgi:hypothetical protein